MKKTILYLLILSTALCIFALTASALGTTESGVVVDYAFADVERSQPLLDENGKQYLTVVGYNGSSQTVNIPETVKMNEQSGELTVRFISDSAFAQDKKITRVIIPETVIEIGDSAFADCTNLMTIDIPPSVTRVSMSMLSGCSILRNVTLPNTLTEIDDFAFEGCIMLNTLKIPASVTTIGHYTFMACESLVLDCSENSYAEQYAKDNNIFTDEKNSPDHIFYITLALSLILGVAAIITDRAVKAALRRKKERTALAEMMKASGDGNSTDA